MKSNEELVQMIQNKIDIPENMQQLYEQNRWFIYKMAKKMIKFSDIEDLMQEAYFGLYEAVNRFEFSQNVNFLTYAAFWIRQVLRRYVDNNGRVVRIPVHEIERVSKYQKIVNDCLMLYGELPPKEYLCYKLGISQKAIENLDRIVNAYNNIQSLDEPCGEDGEGSIIELVASEHNVEDEAINKLISEEHDLWDIIKDYLPENEFKVVYMRYKGKMSLEAIGKHLGISRERVRHFEASGIRHLRVRKTLKRIEERYDIVTNRDISRFAPISQMGITMNENAERRRLMALEARKSVY